jgi:ABC-2 type transport system ATP-binding protein
MNSAIETNNLVKRYGKVTAVDGLSLRVERGEIYAFLGLNGAGKTTNYRGLTFSSSRRKASSSILISKRQNQTWENL